MDAVFEVLSEQVTVPAIYIHVASIVVVIAYLMRDQIALRVLLAIGDALFILFFVTYRTGPIWESVFWDGLILATNVVMIGVLIRERTLIRLAGEERALYAHFNLLTPGEFRRVVRDAEWINGDDETVVIERGTVPEHLYFLLSGSALVEREDRQIEVRDGVFLGEIAFLLRQPATATIRFRTDARAVRWPARDLERLMSRDDRVESMFRALFNRDLAAKVAAG